MIAQRVVKNRWFALADLAFVSVSVILWEIQPRLGWLPLLIALAPWFLRLLAGCFPFQRTGFELPLAVFLLTAAVGVWAAYGPEGAQAKFWLLVGGVLLYYALAGQPQENLWAIAGFLSLVGIGVGCVFLCTHNWQESPAKIGLLNQIGLRWMGVRPDFQVKGMHPNTAGGVIAIAVPFLAALGIKAWSEKRSLLGFWVVVGGSLMVAAFVLATSRGAALALAAGMFLWLWWVLSNQLGRVVPTRTIVVFVVGLVLLIIMAIRVAASFPGGPVGLVNAIPGPPSTGSRLELAESALDLIGDFPFTGGGLDAFQGLYPRYIRDIDAYVTINSHNLYLDVALEQGVLGLLAFVAIYLGSIWLLLTRDWMSPGAILVWASLISLLIALLHGLTDDLVYGRWGAALVLFLPGVAYAVAQSRPKTRGITVLSPYHRWMVGAMGVVVVALVLVVFLNRQPLRAAWYADLGAVRMAKIELRGFALGRASDDFDVAELQPAERLFKQALQYDPRNRTANHRLGRIAAKQNDWEKAVSYLETAHQVDPNHRGIQKALGYSYTWTGQLDQATTLLTGIQEASYEMGIYAWWWVTQGRETLSQRAATMVERLEALAKEP